MKKVFYMGSDFKELFMTERQNAETLINMVKDMKITMLTTIREDGTIHSRPMGNLAANFKFFDGTIWFFSRKNSFKNHDLENDQHINLIYSSPENQRYISVSGRGFVSQDKEKMKELWNPSLKTWFPEGLNDPEISLIGVNIENAEIWDVPSSKIVQALNFVKKAVTGKTYEQKVNGQHIDLRH